MAFNQTDSFTQNFQTSLIDELIDDNWNVRPTNLNDYKLDLKDFGILLNDALTSQNETIHSTNNVNSKRANVEIRHADECDVSGFECVEDLPDLSAKDLIIKEVIEDLILRTFNLDTTLQNSDSTSEIDISTATEIPRIQRCSSLKSGKTPPGTSVCKKIVRFADVLGLDLTDVRTYLDDIPCVPSSAYKDLVNCEKLKTCCPKNTPRNLLALFQQPYSLPDFIKRVTMSMVTIENAYVDDPVSFCIKGFIKVRNLCFHKSIHVRYTMDNWRKSSDVEATFVEGSKDGLTDRFQFMLYAYGLEIGEKLEFAVRYRVNDQEFWDNNQGHNYCFQCLPAEPPTDIPMSPEVKEQFSTFYYDDQTTSMQEVTTEPQSVFDQAVTSKTQLSSAEVQELIARSLGKHEMADVSLPHGHPKPEVVVFFVVLFLSIILFYAKRVLF